MDHIGGDLVTTPAIINACLTGMVATRDRNPYLPVTPEEIAADALAVAAEGASIVHLHARDSVGDPTWDPEVYRDILVRIRAHRPDLILCVTTSNRRWQERDYRTAVLKLEGAVKPDMASLTLGLVRFPDGMSGNTLEDVRYLAAFMRERGIHPELEVFNTDMAALAACLAEEGVLSPPFYVNIILGHRFSAPATEEALDAILGRLPPGTVWAVGGIGRSQATALRLGIGRGGGVRVGLEDNLYEDPEKKVAATNAGLVRGAAAMLRTMGRFLASPAEARERLGIPPYHRP